MPQPVYCSDNGAIVWPAISDPGEGLRRWKVSRLQHDFGAQKPGSGSTGRRIPADQARLTPSRSQHGEGVVRLPAAGAVSCADLEQQPLLNQ